MLTRRDLLKGAAATSAWLASRTSLEAQLGRAVEEPGESLLQFVDPFIGTGGHGHTFPGATTPSGLVQLSPDSGKQGWDWCAGYHYSDTEIAGFSHTHLSGTGIGDLCDISVMPVLAGRTMPESVTSPFSHQREKATPGYYAVDLLANEIKVELTATRRVGIHRYRFPRWIPARPPAVVFDLGFAINWDKTVDAALSIDGPTTISGYRFSSGWAKDQRVYFAARFSTAVNQWLIGAAGDYSAERRQAQGPNLKALFRPVLRPGDPLMIKVALSPVSAQAALKNLETEAPGWDFDAYKRDAEDAWERKLRRVRIDTPDKARKTVFYTGMYHALLAPTLACDADRAYRGADGNVMTPTFQNHTVFSLWDTFRALHPLLTIVQGERVDSLVQSMMAFYREQGQLPVWSLWGNETNTMIGYHSAPVIVDAIMKNLTTVDRGEALDALKKAAFQEARGLNWLNGPETRGYIPCDKEAESVSKTLEYAFDDWCVARLAGKLERTSDRRLFEARAGFYKNVFDPSTGFMRARLSDGSWKSPFNPRYSQHEKHDYTEGTAWQHTWSVMHDVRGLMQLMGGADPFVKKLDGLFNEAPVIDGTNASPDISGLIGQYAHGNEPSHHIAYLYAYAGAPWLTQARVRQITSTLYSAAPDGLCGNEDCGQMSAWYLLSAMGFYPVNPADGTYVLGAPQVDRAAIDLGGGTTFTIEAESLNETNQYVKGVTLNGKPLDRCWISHEEIAAGGTLRFTMASEPNRAWASSPEAAPPSMTKLAPGA
jgi:predicted alpha-1,2-mannosidase